MNLAPHLRAGRSPASSLPWLACIVALSGCGGATYSIGNVPGDGGPDAEGGGATVSCPGCEGGTTLVAGDDSGASGFSGDDGASSVTSGNEGGSGFHGSDAGVTAAGCTPAPIACAVGATGYGCPPGGVHPTDSQPALSCTSGEIGPYGVEYCCFPWPTGTGCKPFESFPCNGSYPYQCSPGTTPPDVDPKLSCGSSFADSNGQNDFCCTFP